eukprot:1568339-Heterocapsa_arctica.AAC.1
MSLRFRSRCACARMYLSVGLARARGRWAFPRLGRSAHARGADLRRPAQTYACAGPCAWLARALRRPARSSVTFPPGAAGGTVVRDFRRRERTTG